MKILITGSSGFVGSNLARFFIDAGHPVVGIDAVPRPQIIDNALFRFIQADTAQPGAWQELIKEVDVVINLAGKNIFNRWNEQYKKLIYESRILTTKHVVEALPDQTNIVLISTSAVGYYGDQGDNILNENASAGDDFLARVCSDWEKEANEAKKKGARVIIVRFSVVLGKSGGALSKMIPAYRLFVGGPLGDGMQWFPWIHISDLLGAMKYVIDHTEVEGALNFCSPQPVRNNDFSKALAKKLGRPAIFRVPGFMLRLAAGELGNLALYSQRGYPGKLLSAGYDFEFPDLESAISACIN